METSLADTTILDGYVTLLDTLSPSHKLDLIARLTASVKSDITKKESTLKFNAAGIGNCFISEITLAELKFGVENSPAPTITELCCVTF